MQFKDIVGNEKVKDRLRLLVEKDTLPHAILLHGNEGTGKLAIARAFAQYIHCQNPQDGEPCGKCPSCIQHQTFNHSDLHFVFPIIKKKSPTLNISDDYIAKWRDFLSKYKYESYERWLNVLENDNAQPMIYVEESDSIIHKMSLTSYSSRYQIMILWLPEKMNEPCANKLLKIIEEPFPNTLFILVSDSPKEILPTIFSRVQRIEINRPSIQDISQYLVECYNIDQKDAIAIGALSDGNIIKAEEMLNLKSENKLFFEKFVTLMRAAYIRDIKGLKIWADQITELKREKERRFLSYCSHLLRENFIYNFQIPDLNYITQAEEQFSKKFSPFINERNISTMIDEFQKAENDIQRNGNGKIILFDLALKITKLIKL